MQRRILSASCFVFFNWREGCQELLLGLLSATDAVVHGAALACRGRHRLCVRAAKSSCSASSVPPTPSSMAPPSPAVGPTACASSTAAAAEAAIRPRASVDDHLVLPLLFRLKLVLIRRYSKRARACAARTRRLLLTQLYTWC